MFIREKVSAAAAAPSARWLERDDDRAGGRGRGFRCGSGDFDERGLRERERASERGSGAERSLKNCSVSLSPTGSATTAPTHSTAAAGRGTETLEDDDPPAVLSIDSSYA